MIIPGLSVITELCIIFVGIFAYYVYLYQKKQVKQQQEDLAYMKGMEIPKVVSPTERTKTKGFTSNLNFLKTSDAVNRSYTPNSITYEKQNSGLYNRIFKDDQTPNISKTSILNTTNKNPTGMISPTFVSGHHHATPNTDTKSEAPRITDYNSLYNDRVSNGNRDAIPRDTREKLNDTMFNGKPAKVDGGLKLFPNNAPFVAARTPNLLDSRMTPIPPKSHSDNEDSYRMFESHIRRENKRNYNQSPDKMKTEQNPLDTINHSKGSPFKIWQSPSVRRDTAGEPMEKEPLEIEEEPMQQEPSSLSIKSQNDSRSFRNSKSIEPVLTEIKDYKKPGRNHSQNKKSEVFLDNIAPEDKKNDKKKSLKEELEKSTKRPNSPNRKVRKIEAQHEKKKLIKTNEAVGKVPTGRQKMVSDEDGASSQEEDKAQAVNDKSFYKKKKPSMDLGNLKQYGGSSGLKKYVAQKTILDQVNKKFDTQDQKTEKIQDKPSLFNKPADLTPSKPATPPPASQPKSIISHNPLMDAQTAPPTNSSTSGLIFNNLKAAQETEKKHENPQPAKEAEKPKMFAFLNQPPPATASTVSENKPGSSLLANLVAKNNTDNGLGLLKKDSSVALPSLTSGLGLEKQAEVKPSGNGGVSEFSAGVDSVRKQIAAVGTPVPNPSLTSKASETNATANVTSASTASFLSLLTAKPNDDSKPAGANLLSGSTSVNFSGGLFGNLAKSTGNSLLGAGSSLLGANLVTAKPEEAKKEENKADSNKTDAPAPLVNNPFHKLVGVTGGGPSLLPTNLGLGLFNNAGSGSGMNLLAKKEDGASDNKNNLLSSGASTMFTRNENDSKSPLASFLNKPSGASTVGAGLLFGNNKPTPDATAAQVQATIPNNPLMASSNSLLGNMKSGSSLFGGLGQPNLSGLGAGPSSLLGNGGKIDLFKTQTSSNAPLASLLQNNNSSSLLGGDKPANISLFGGLGLPKTNNNLIAGLFANNTPPPS
jgi:hypothetical protein